MEFESETFWVSVTLEYVRLMSWQRLKLKRVARSRES